MGYKNVLAKMGVCINAKRRGMKMTQEQLAEKTDVSVQMISNLELGKKAIRPENLVNLCKRYFLDCHALCLHRTQAREKCNFADNVV